ncbi:MAG: Bro-N domain-containing protein [Clostridiales bacterium]|nr:Bro-N domain-containing protein [Clostridiales bacterium]
MKLKLVKQGEFLGTTCDFYVDEKENIYMSRTQIGYALQYKDPANAILRIHQRNHERLDKMSVDVKGCQFVTPYINKDKNAHTYMYREKGIYEICRHSKQPLADNFYDWVYETISAIRSNGYYIASEKDNKWLGIREESKQARRYETDQIKLFIEYAKDQGSKNADRYYTIITKMVNGKLGIGSGQRDSVSQETLMEIKALETLVKMRMRKLMDEKVPYKEIYRDVKKMVEEF